MSFYDHLAYPPTISSSHKTQILEATQSISKSNPNGIKWDIVLENIVHAPNLIKDPGHKMNNFTSVIQTQDLDNTL